jgi:DNA-binding MarR family transcriptional regulator
MSAQLVLGTLKKFRIIIGAVRQHSRALEAACGIGGTQVWMLATIAESPDITVSQVSQALSIHISTASNLLDKMARAGLVDRVRGEEDRRVVRLRLTEEGKAIIDRAPKPITGLVFNALEQLPTDALTRLDGDLSNLIAKMDQVDQSAANEPMANLVR